MKLGFWNRLALVAGVLLSVGGASYTVLEHNNSRYKALSSGYDTCVSGVGKPGSDLTLQFCYDSWLAHMNTMGWDAWLQFIGVYAAAYVALYLVIWCFVWVTKWVWRGRKEFS